MSKIFYKVKVLEFNSPLSLNKFRKTEMLRIEGKMSYDKYYDTNRHHIGVMSKPISMINIMD